MLARTYLFVPGDQSAVLAKADSRGADALIIDLEDAVAPSRKDAARAVTSAWLAGNRQSQSQWWVRINSGSHGIEDLRTIGDAAIDGVVLPKLTNVEEVAEWSERIEGLQSGCRLIVIIETAGAMRDVDRIASHSNVWQLMIGEADLGGDIGMTADNPAWDSLRVNLVVASAAAGLEPPIGPVDPDFSSADRLEDDTRRLKDMGFASRSVIHPAQIAPVHRAFDPTLEELDAARTFVDRHEKALSGGHGVHVDEDGHMVDEAFVRRARRVVHNSHRGI